MECARCTIQAKMTFCSSVKQIKDICLSLEISLDFISDCSINFYLSHLKEWYESLKYFVVNKSYWLQTFLIPQTISKLFLSSRVSSYITCPVELANLPLFVCNQDLQGVFSWSNLIFNNVDGRHSFSFPAGKV